MEVQGRHMYSSSDTNNMLRLHHPGFSLGGINPDLLSPHHHHSTPDFGVATGFRPPKPTAHMQDFPSNHINPGNPVSSPCPLIAPNPNLVAAQMEAHQLETDLLLTLQYERLRRGVQEQRKHELGEIIKWYERKARSLLQQKDEEIARGLNRMVELEQLLKGIKAQNASWQRVAKQNEAVITSVNHTIQQLQCQRQEGGAAVVEDAESCCTGTGDAEGRNKCRRCKGRSACVILLPCRHLCCCSHCVPFIGCCPLCGVLPTSSLQVLFY